MTFRFDEEIDRKGTYSVKWEFVLEGRKLINSERAYPVEGEIGYYPCGWLIWTSAARRL